VTCPSKSKPAAKSKPPKRETPAEKRIRHLSEVGDFLTQLSESFSSDEMSSRAFGHAEKVRSIVADMKAAEALRSVGHVCDPDPSVVRHRRDLAAHLRDLALAIAQDDIPKQERSSWMAMLQGAADELAPRA
jgi:hypothetical protein